MQIQSGQKFGRSHKPTSAQTISILRQVFTIFALPEQIVSDNGTQFTSEEFNVFCRKNGIKHIRSAPYHPATNGAVERFVQTFKRALKSGRKEGRDTQHVISNFLLRYRSTPHTLTGVAPCTLMLKRDIRTRLHLLRPDRESQVISGQANQKSNHDKRCKMREFKVGESVMVRNYRTSGDKWISRVITHKNGDLSYEVKLQSGNYCKRHIDQIVERGNFVEIQDNLLDPYSTSFNDNFQPTITPSHSNTESSEPSHSNSTTIDPMNQPSRYPIRTCKPPNRYSEERW